MTVPLIGERYRGTEGRSGYLLRQAWHTFRGAMEAALRLHGLTGAQYAALSVLARDPGASGADLARACNTSPQAMNGVLATLEREGLVERHRTPRTAASCRPSPERGRAGSRPRIPTCERWRTRSERGLTAEQMVAVKAWLVASAQRLEQTGAAPGAD